MYDTVYVLDTKSYSTSYPLSDRYITLATNKSEPLLDMRYIVPAKFDREKKTLTIAKSFFNNLMNTRVYLYSINGKVVGAKRYVNSSDIKSIPIKNVESGTFKEIKKKDALNHEHLFFYLNLLNLSMILLAGTP